MHYGIQECSNCDHCRRSLSLRCALDDRHITLDEHCKFWVCFAEKECVLPTKTDKGKQ